MRPEVEEWLYEACVDLEEALEALNGGGITGRASPRSRLRRRL
ncbi:MAG: hypothetical protein QXN15_10570 [Candidatus Jordarchaeales archaeon]